jgi:hypothetical protein
MEQSLWRNAALTAAYVGNKGNRLYSVRDINQNVYNNDTEGDELSGRPYITKFPYLSYIDMLENYDFSIYHSLQVTLKQQTTNGLFFVAAIHGHILSTMAARIAVPASRIVTT